MKKFFFNSVENNLSVPKYQQIIDTILEKLNNGELKKGDKLPSLNMLYSQYSLSQDTVLRAYNELKAKGIISSQVGKGYFIQNENTAYKYNVLLVFDTLTAYKEQLYDAFKETLQPDGKEQIFFHHNNLKMFQTIIEDANGHYSQYVIMPIIHPDAMAVLGKLPEKKVFILDQGKKQFQDIYPFVCQDFEHDLYNILKENSSLVSKYRRMILVIRTQKSHFKDIRNGFIQFCKEYPIAAEIVSDIHSMKIRKGDAFIVADDRDLEFLVRYSLEKKMALGIDLGIVSYNETPLKGIVASGITTISTDFTKMGKTMALMILKHKKQKLTNPFVITKRSSF